MSKTRPNGRHHPRTNKQDTIACTSRHATMTTVGPIDKQKKAPAISHNNQGKDNHEKHHTGESHIQRPGRNATMTNALRIYKIKERREFFHEGTERIGKSGLKGLRI